MTKQFLRAVTTLYILLPSFLFAYGWLKLPFAIIILTILSSFTVTIVIDVFRTFPIRLVLHELKTQQTLSRDSISGILLALLLIVIWLAFSGAGGVGFQNADYRASNALLNDLITQDWPLSAGLADTQVPIVYYVAYYLPSAVIGKALGWASANIFSFLWTLVGVLLAFAWFLTVSRVDLKNRGIKLWILLTGIFCLAGGLDYIGGYVLDTNVFSLSAHIEPWAHYFEYASNTTLIYWVPQHTIVPWLVIGLIGDALYNRYNLKYLGMAVTAGIIWSPFGIVGTAPYLGLLLLVYSFPRYRKYICNWESILFNALSIGIGAVYLLYLGSNQFRFPMGFIWQLSKNHVVLVSHLLAFWSLEFGVLGFLSLFFIGAGILSSHSTACSESKDRTWVGLLAQEFGITSPQLFLFLVSLSVLAVLPFFKMGINNDLVMRGSIASFFIFWAFVAKVIADVRFEVRTKFKLLYMLISMIVTIGFFTSFNEIARSAIMYEFGAPSPSNQLTTINANETDVVLQRIGSEDSIFYRYLGK
jgi:hypothetical protein